MVLNRIYKDYLLPLELYIRLKKAMGYESKKDINEINYFVDSLPHKLKVEVSLHIYEERYNRIKFFKNRTPSFITWMCPLLKPSYIGEHQFIFLEGDDVIDIYFMIRGKAGFVLPSYHNAKYIDINVGD